MAEGGTPPEEMEQLKILVNKQQSLYNRLEDLRRNLRKLSTDKRTLNNVKRFLDNAQKLGNEFDENHREIKKYGETLIPPEYWEKAKLAHNGFREMVQLGDNFCPELRAQARDSSPILLDESIIHKNPKIPRTPPRVMPKDPVAETSTKTVNDLTKTQVNLFDEMSAAFFELNQLPMEQKTLENMQHALNSVSSQWMNANTNHIQLIEWEANLSPEYYSAMERAQRAMSDVQQLVKDHAQPSRGQVSSSKKEPLWEQQLKQEADQIRKNEERLTQAKQFGNNYDIEFYSQRLQSSERRYDNILHLMEQEKQVTSTGTKPKRLPPSNTLLYRPLFNRDDDQHQQQMNQLVVDPPHPVLNDERNLPQMNQPPLIHPSSDHPVQMRYQNVSLPPMSHRQKSFVPNDNFYVKKSQQTFQQEKDDRFDQPPQIHRSYDRQEPIVNYNPTRPSQSQLGSFVQQPNCQPSENAFSTNYNSGAQNTQQDFLPRKNRKQVEPQQWQLVRNRDSVNQTNGNQTNHQRSLEDSTQGFQPRPPPQQQDNHHQSGPAENPSTEFFSQMKNFFQSIANNSTPQDNSSSRRGFRIPEIQLKSFGGEPGLYKAFKDGFMSIIGNADTTPIERLTFLKSKLTGPALVEVETLNLTDSNYEFAWQMLDRRFDNRRIIIESNLETLYRPPKIYDNVAESYLRVMQAFDCSIRNLDDLKINWKDALMSFFAIRTMDQGALRKLDQYLGAGTDLPNWYDVRDFMEMEYEITVRNQIRLNFNKSLNASTTKQITTQPARHTRNFATQDEKLAKTDQQD